MARVYDPKAPKFDSSLPIKERAARYAKYIRESPDYKVCTTSPESFSTSVRTSSNPNPTGQHFDASVLRQCELLDAKARDPKVLWKEEPLAWTAWKVYIPVELTNAGYALHGGAVATLFDMLTSATISCVDNIEGSGWEVNNVSRTLNCTYLKPIMEGEYTRVECEVTALGKRNGMTRGVMRKWNKDREDGAGGEVCYTCEHGKVNTGIQSSKL
ncbi:putative thioesterase superfamily protein [Botryosphaeria dothidea]|uniref:Thioesterase superfamily protein n=1 Tax=Botryosphaeria dothidea TaxID=55169 RepID=A0A8H4IJ62_9PEZI|nr:putative thioesterase superfamily protein [Botryosphaeria dothidea]